MYLCLSVFIANHINHYPNFTKVMDVRDAKLAYESTGLIIGAHRGVILEDWHQRQSNHNSEDARNAGLTHQNLKLHKIT